MCNSSRQVGASDEGQEFAVVRELIASRQTVLPKRLVEPGPSAEQLEQLLRLAADAPDHGCLTPWHFVIVPTAQRHRLAEVFAWTPPGQLGRALATASSDPAGAAVHLVLGVVWLPLLWWLHGVTTGKLVTAPVRPGTEGRRVRTGTVGVRAGVLALLPPGRATAVGARTVRTKMRTPREAVNTVVALLLGMGALVVAPMLGGSPDGRIVLTAGLLHFAVLFESSNAFGFDGPALWMEVAAGADGPVLVRGKALTVQDAETAIRLARLDVRPWADLVDHPYWVRISVHSISGRQTVHP